MHPGAFDRADVHEDILAAIIRLDEAEAFLAVEPLHGSSRHITLPSGRCERRPRASAAGWFEIWRKVVSPTRGRGEAKSFGRSSMGQCEPLRLGVQGFTGKSLEKRLAIWPTSAHSIGLSEHRHSTV